MEGEGSVMKSEFAQGTVLGWRNDYVVLIPFVLDEGEGVQFWEGPVSVERRGETVLKV